MTGLRAWQTERFYGEADPARASDAREAASAALLEAQLGSDERAIVWAEPRSLFRQRERVDLDAIAGGTTSLGTALAYNFGDAFVPIVLAGFDPRVGPTAIERKLHAVGDPQLFVDVADPSFDSFLPREQRVALGVPGDALVPREQLRALVFFDLGR
jgi:hypothetical protein